MCCVGGRHGLGYNTSSDALTHSVVWNMTEVPVICPSGISNDKGLQLLSGVTIIYLDIRSRPTNNTISNNNKLNKFTIAMYLLWLQLL